ncbi:MAG: Rpn family recombination-promoting nuclease/putative transposase [Eubacteriales bacterium]
MGKENVVTNQYISNPNIFADMINFKVYQGEQIVKADDLRELDVSLLAILEDGKVVKTIEKHRDVVKLWKVMSTEQVTYCIFGIENQSLIHYAMPVRTMLYDILQYQKQVDNIGDKHKNSNDYRGHSNGEFLSKFYKEDKLIPVITIVMYWGSESWDGPRSLKEMMIDVPEKLEPFFQDYKLFLIEPEMLQEEELDLLQTDLKEVMSFMKYQRDKKKMKELLQNTEKLKHLDANTAMVINSVTKLKIKINKEESEEVNMCQAIDEMMEDSRLLGVDQGISQGIEQGIEYTMINLIIKKMQKGKSVEIIAEELEYEIQYITPIVSVVCQYAPEYDVDAIMKAL